MGKGQSYQQMVLGKLDIQMQKNKVWPLYIIYKKYFKIDQRLKNIKLLKENTGEKLYDIGFRSGNAFLNMTPKAQATKSKIDKWNYIKQKPLRIKGHNQHRLKMQPMEWEKIFSNYLYD